MRMQGFRRKLYLAVYDKPGVNRRALQFRHSMDEVKNLLGSQKKKEKK